MGRVEGKVAVITGAARGQGRSHAVRLAEEGADIIAIDVCGQIDTVSYPMATADDLARTVKEVEALGRRIVAAQADVRDDDALAAAIDDGVAQLGRLDIVAANAGVSCYASVQELTSQMWRDVIDVNLTGVWHTCKAALPYLRDGGSIVITSSLAGLKGLANIAHYDAAKHGLVGLMRSLAVELAPRMIRVNSVHPTTVNTDMIHNQPTYELFAPDLEDPTREQVTERFQTLNLLPVPWVEARDVSNAVVFLASDEARYITGVTLPVDAGASAK